MPDDLLRMLEEMDQSATKAPWYPVPPPWGDNECAVAGSTDPHGREAVLQIVPVDDVEADEEEELADKWNRLEARARVNLSVACRARNSLPALLDVLRAADAMRRWSNIPPVERKAYDAARARFAQAIKEGKG